MIELMSEIYRAIFTAIKQRAHLIGNVIVGKTKQEILDQEIKDKGDFYRNTEYRVIENDDTVTLFVGSNVKHEPYVLGGKVPSWTPLKPLMAWVERKDLGWVHESGKKKGEKMTIEEMAYLIRGKIKREGIEERNVFAEVIKNQESWIHDQLNSIEAVLS